jgi:hypothetical protein
MPDGLEDAVGVATQAVVTGVVLALGEEVVEGGAVVPTISDLSGGQDRALHGIVGGRDEGLTITGLA